MNKRNQSTHYGSDYKERDRRNYGRDESGREFDRAIDRRNGGDFDRSFDRNYDESRERSLYRSSGQRQDSYKHGPHSGKGPKGFQRSAESLKERVCEELESNGYLDASEIEVAVKNCEVTLTGKVCSRDEKREAERCAESVSGVKDVHNRLTVDSSMGRGSQSDTDRTAQSRANK